MAADNWASVLGAALGAGTHTFQELTEQERIQREREAARALETQRFAAQQAMAEKQFGLQHQQFESGEKDRRMRQIVAALEHSDPGQIFSKDFVNEAGEFGLGGRFEQKPTLTGVTSLPGGITLPQVDQQFARKATAEETAALEDRNHLKTQREDTEQFRSHLQTPEHLAEGFDQQQAEAFAHGVNNMPMSAKEFDRRQAIEQRGAERLASIRTQPFGGSTPRIDALVEEIKRDPAGFQALPAALKTKLAPYLAEAGFQGFAKPPADTSGVEAYKQERDQRVFRVAQELRDAVGATTTGIGGALTRAIPGTPASNFAAKMATLKSNIMAAELTAMRQASKTGGALGQVSDFEGQLLANARVALDQAQSPEQIYAELSKLIDDLSKADQMWAGALATQGGAGRPPMQIVGGQQPVPQSQGGAPLQVGRFKVEVIK